jgi:hypothetical protein
VWLKPARNKFRAEHQIPFSTDFSSQGFSHFEPQGKLSPLSTDAQNLHHILDDRPFLVMNHLLNSWIYMLYLSEMNTKSQYDQRV